MCGGFDGVEILVFFNGLLDFEVVLPGGVCDVVLVSDVLQVVW